MKSQIDLYPQKLHPKLRLLSLSIVIIFWVLTLALMLSSNFYFSSKQQSLQQEVNQIDKSNHQQAALLKALQDELTNIKADPELMSQVSKQQQMASLKKRVYNELVGQEKSKTTGFATLMLDLAKNHHSDIWLTRLYLNDKNIAIEGAANESASIPIWLNDLGNASYFKGQEFSDTRIYRDEDDQLHFTLATSEMATSSKEVIHE